MRDEAGTALGQASLTVEEQANMIATLADGGVYHTPHVIKDIIIGNATTPAKINTTEVLTPDEAAEVDYAMSFDMGSLGTANGLGLTNGQTVIAKTGTTNLSQSAFFLGATPRYAMAVGMFVSKPHCPASLQSLCTSTQALAFAPPAGVQTLFGVGGLAGYGGQWPAVIWHDYFMKEFEQPAGPVVARPPGQLRQRMEPGPAAAQAQAQAPAVRQRQRQPLPVPEREPAPRDLPAGQPDPMPRLAGGGRWGGGGGGNGGGAGGAGTVGGAAAGGIVTTGLTVTMLPAGARRWRARRRQRGPGAAKRKT